MTEPRTTPSRRIHVIDDPRFDLHVAPVPHPEQPARLKAIRSGLTATLLENGAERVAPRMVRGEELARVHSPEHIAELERELSRGAGVIDDDTFISAGTHDATWLAAGGAAVLAERLMAAREPSIGVLTARPPGHHATRTRAMGFCLLNNVAVAATTALNAGAKKVAILDWDVHHGNGTQAIFEDDPRVLFLSLHQWPLYPGTGRSDEIGMGPGRGSTVNMPLPSRADARDYAASYKQVALPALEQFKPDLLLLSCGFDAHKDDPLGGMLLEDQDYGAMTTMMLDLERRLGINKLGVVLEGGYDLGALERASNCVAQALLGKRYELAEGNLTPGVQRSLDATRHALDSYVTF